MIEKVLRTFHNPNEPEGRVTQMQVGGYAGSIIIPGIFLFADCMDYSTGGGNVGYYFGSTY